MSAPTPRPDYRLALLRLALAMWEWGTEEDYQVGATDEHFAAWADALDLLGVPVARFTDEDGDERIRIHGGTAALRARVAQAAAYPPTPDALDRLLATIEELARGVRARDGLLPAELARQIADATLLAQDVRRSIPPAPPPAPARPRAEVEAAADALWADIQRRATEALWHDILRLVNEYADNAQGQEATTAATLRIGIVWLARQLGRPSPDDEEETRDR